jgi:drug/metabolite transporter (DMT)-like permease
MWSLQFIFLRVAVPFFGTPAVAEARALFGALFLLPWAIWVARQPLRARERWRDHVEIALVNNVAPFLCFAWAATVLPASYLAVINGMVPLWTAVMAALVLKEPFGARRAAGFLLGIGGVALIANLGPLELTARTAAGTLAAVGGAFFWGWAGVLIKQRSEHVPAMGLAAGSIACAALIMAPLWLSAPAPAAWTGGPFLSLLAVGLICSGLAYLPFFTLIRDIGPSRTLTVGLAVPVLGVLWGWLLLDEAVTLTMLLGMALVVAALALVQRR